MVEFSLSQTDTKLEAHTSLVCFRVFATTRRLESMQDLSARGIETLALDVTDIEAIRRVRDDIAIKTGGKLDVLVNNAWAIRQINGWPEFHNLLEAYAVAATDMDMAAVRALYELNVFAPMCMVQEFIHLLISSSQARIVNIGSLSGITPVPFSAAYNTSKAALHAFGNTLRVELAPFNISVVTVVTGGVQSNIVKPNSIPEHSLYKSMEKVYQEKRINMSQNNATPAGEYARIVVAETKKANPRGWLWAAHQSTVVWFIDTFLPRGFMTWMMARMFGFAEFSVELRKGKDKRV
ncbi:Short chain dehydrogenase reductase [Mycena sanguinolenta]|uniref:Short chain dehydrogenase reductase n=1 Tax=Mycena sanguinolenta TaxID=230812 RepID=A0A8H7D788_9AGAR|nr:Short chain dehydrogenase reductase [Mycena sanguinolenta]